jgi:hypothetical protein
MSPANTCQSESERERERMSEKEKEKEKERKAHEGLRRWSSYKQSIRQRKYRDTEIEIEIGRKSG